MPYLSGRGEIREPRVGDVVYRGVLESNRIVTAVRDGGQLIEVFSPMNGQTKTLPTAMFFYYGHSPRAAAAAEAEADLTEVCP